MKKTKTLEFGGGGDPLSNKTKNEADRIFNTDINPLPSTPLTPSHPPPPGRRTANAIAVPTLGGVLAATLIYALYSSN